MSYNDEIVYFDFTPQPDITAYELAKIINLLVLREGWITKTSWDDLIDAQRNLTRKREYDGSKT
jgi:hypothetical protein